MHEIRGEFQDVLVVSELRGSFPDVPFFADVDIAELTKGDPDPLYLTIPIGKANVISGNKRYYDEAWLAELERQVRANRPIGIMGHLSEEDLNTKFPEEAVFWVGVQRVGEMLWAKGYIPKASAARERILRYKGAKKPIGTSIFAKAEGVWNKARGAFDMLAETLQLQQIDIGPADRIGIPALASVPILTAEMQAEMQNEAVTPQEDNVDAKQVIQELSKAKPAPKRGWQPSYTQEVAELAAIREVLGADEDANLARLVSEMKQTQEAQAQAAIKQRISELVTEGVKVESVRGLVSELVAAKQPQTVDEAAAAYQQVIEMQSVKDTLAATVQKTMGPRQTTPLAPQNGKAKYFVIPAEKQEA